MSEFISKSFENFNNIPSAPLSPVLYDLSKLMSTGVFSDESSSITSLLPSDSGESETE